MTSESSSSAFACLFCGKDLLYLDSSARQAHYDVHLSEEEPSAQPTWMHNPSHSAQQHAPRAMSFFSVSCKERDHQDVFWRPSLDRQPPQNYSPGLISVLQQSLALSHEKGFTRHAVLCFADAVHITHESFDRGWGCGYRNFLMACVTLAEQSIQPEYARLLDASRSPSVRNLQDIIERAWVDGFDAEGARQLKHKLRGTSKWIGTAELHVAFAYLGVPSRLADFALQRTSFNTRDTRPLLDWVRAYFDSVESEDTVDLRQTERAVVMSSRMPLILQHDGHSRTVVGYETTKSGQTNLLVFDPATRIRGPLRSSGMDFRIDQGARVHNNRNMNARSPRFMQSVKHPLRTAKHAKNKHLPASKHDSAKRHDSGELEAVNIDSDSSAVKFRESTASRHIGGRAVVAAVDYPLNQSQDDGTSSFPAGSSLSVSATLNVFRLNSRRLEHHSKYQVLWFPLHNPLSTAEKQTLQVVTSEKVC